MKPRPKHPIVVDLDMTVLAGDVHAILDAVSNALEQVGEPREVILAYRRAALDHHNLAGVLSESAKWVVLRDTSGMYGLE